MVSRGLGLRVQGSRNRHCGVGMQSCSFAETSAGANPENILLSVKTLYTHRLHGSFFLGLPYRILNMNHKKELLWSLYR